MEQKKSQKKRRSGGIEEAEERLLPNDGVTPGEESKVAQADKNF
jgi:hypothetical protein